MGFEAPNIGVKETNMGIPENKNGHADRQEIVV